MLAIAVAGFGAVLARRLRDGEPSPLSPSLWRWATAFLAVAGASAVSSVLRGETLYLLLRGRAEPLFVNGLWMPASERNRAAVVAFLGAALLLVAYDAFARVSREALTRTLVLASLLGATAACLEPWLPVRLTGPPWMYIHRRSGTFSDPNALGVGLALLAPVTLTALLRGGTAMRAACAAALVLAVPALNLSGSRSGLLLLVAAGGAAGVGLFRGRPRLRPALIGGAVLLVALAVAAWRYGPRSRSTSAGRLLERIGSAFSAEGMEDFATHRPLFWAGAFEVIKEEPLSGCGLGAFPFEFPLRSRRPVVATDNATNALLDLAAEGGLPALALALAAVIPLLVRALDAAFGRGSPPADRAAGAALSGLAVASLTGSHLRFPEIALFTAALTALLPPPSEEAPVEEDAVRIPRRTPWVLAASGILASILVVLPTRKTEAAFRAGKWVGLYGWELRDGVPYQRWIGPRAFRRLSPKERAKEEKILLIMLSARPDNRPVLVTIDADGRPLLSKTLLDQTPTPLTLEPPAGTEVLRLRFEPSFVPRALTGQGDFRRLAVQLPYDSGEMH